MPWEVVHLLAHRLIHRLTVRTHRRWRDPSHDLVRVRARARVRFWVRDFELGPVLELG